jgi:3'-phosphoadenosine 5'-phosphosulfate sulfotransferase (PAPS reductase)/FAD synthetase
MSNAEAKSFSSDRGVASQAATGRDPFKIDGPTCLSFSTGRSSAYMLKRVIDANPREALARWLMVCFGNTGKEEEASLRFWRDCAKHWRIPIVGLEYVLGPNGPTYKVVEFKDANRTGKPFEAVIAQRGGVLPNRVSRFCSSELKTRTIHRYLRDLGWTEWDSLVGIRADEPRRVAKFRANPSPETKAEEVHLPLAIAGVTAGHVGEFWRTQPFDLGLPNMNGKTMHGNCTRCFLKPAAAILSLETERHDPWWAEQEAHAEKVTDGDGKRFRNDRPSYAQIAIYAASQRDIFDPNEEAIACFCGD